MVAAAEAAAAEVPEVEATWVEDPEAEAIWAEVPEAEATWAEDPGAEATWVADTEAADRWAVCPWADTDPHPRILWAARVGGPITGRWAAVAVCP